MLLNILPDIPSMVTTRDMRPAEIPQYKKKHYLKCQKVLHVYQLGCYTAQDSKAWYTYR